MPRDSILIVGSVALDDVKTPFGAVQETFGGSASYAAMAAQFFAPVRIVAVVGTDFPAACRNLLAKHDIDTEGLEVAQGKTFRWGGVYSNDMNHRDTLFTNLNVFEHFHPKVPESYRDSPYVLLGNIHPSLQAEVLEQVASPKLVALDTMNLWLDIARDDLLKVLRSVHLFILNDEEARQLTEEANLVLAGRAILGLGPSTVVIKKGEHGAMMFRKEAIFSIPALPLDLVKDPTGAGDVFAGGMVGYLTARGDLSEASFRAAMAYGTVLASFTVEEFGLQSLQNVRHEQLEERYSKLRKLTQFEEVRRLAPSRT